MRCPREREQRKLERNRRGRAVDVTRQAEWAPLPGVPAGSIAVPSGGLSRGRGSIVRELLPNVAVAVSRAAGAQETSWSTGETESYVKSPSAWAHGRARGVSESLFSTDPVWALYAPTADPEKQECLECSELIATIRGTKSGLVRHAKRHLKQGQLYSKQQLKAWLVGSMIAVLNIPIRAFQSVIFKILFYLAGLGPISDVIARKLAAAEAV